MTPLTAFSYMQELKKAFKKAFNIPFSALPLPEYKLFPIGEDELLFGSEEAVRTPILRVGDNDRFMIKCSPGFFMVGFWGHGVNSYAFYYSRIDQLSKIYFRLAYGGVYTNNEKAAKEIAKFLPTFFKFEAEIKGLGYHLVAVDAMWEGWYQVTTPEGKRKEYNKSLLEHPKFSEVLGSELTVVNNKDMIISP